MNASSVGHRRFIDAALTGMQASRGARDERREKNSEYAVERAQMRRRGDEVSAGDVPA